MSIHSAKLSAICFSSSLVSTSFVIAPKFGLSSSCFVENLWWILLSYYLVINLFLRLFLRNFHYDVAVRAAFLGFTFSVGVVICILAPSSWCVFGWYMCIMSLFHYSEFFMIAITNPRSLSVDSFILNHSVEYGIAAVTSWVEFLIEWWFFPRLKELVFVSVVGIVLCISGEVLRKLAMFTAKTNFDHIVQSVRKDGHQLITHGVYKYTRHPSYVGWFYWSIGTQLILVNPICTVAYTVASWRFFHERVLVEEITLLNFFGEDYYRYQKKVGTGLPFIEGYKLQL